MERQKIISTVIDALGYARVLEIRFESGRIYQYYDVPAEVYDAMLAAPSKGQYFNAHIRGKYGYQEIKRLDRPTRPRKPTTNQPPAAISSHQTPQDNQTDTIQRGDQYPMTTNAKATTNAHLDTPPKAYVADDLNLLSEDQLWKVATDRGSNQDVRMEAMRRWLNPNAARPDGNDGSRLDKVKERATLLEAEAPAADPQAKAGAAIDENEENIEVFHQQGMLFDDEGRLILEVNGKRYLIEK